MTPAQRETLRRVRKDLHRTWWRAKARSLKGGLVAVTELDTITGERTRTLMGRDGHWIL